MRDVASVDQLLALAKLESQNALLIKQMSSKQERFNYGYYPHRVG